MQDSEMQELLVNRHAQSVTEHANESLRLRLPDGPSQNAGDSDAPGQNLKSNIVLQAHHAASKGIGVSEKLKLKFMGGGEIRRMNGKVVGSPGPDRARRVESLMISAANRRLVTARRWILARCWAAVASCPMRRGGGFVPDSARRWLLGLPVLPDAAARRRRPARCGAAPAVASSQSAEFHQCEPE